MESLVPMLTTQDAVSEAPASGRTTRTFVKGRVSVITAVYNAAPTLVRCIDSVKLQDYHDVEHVLMDGGSTDGSLDIIKSYDGQIIWKSERDSGIYDAWNKGLANATGEWIAFLGADDLYLPGALSAYMNALCDDQLTDYASSLVRLVYAPGVTRVIGRPWSWPKFQKFMTTAHVGSLHRYRLFNRYGIYDPAYRMVGDYELLLRPRQELRTRFIPIVTVEMQAGGATDSFASLHEAEKAKVLTGGRIQFFARIETLVGIAKLTLRKRLTKFRVGRAR